MTHPTPEQERAAEERLKKRIDIVRRIASHGIGTIHWDDEQGARPVTDQQLEDGFLGSCAVFMANDAALLLSVVERQREALRRLGSIEAMTMSFYNKEDTQPGKELRARIDYARAALGESND